VDSVEGSNVQVVVFLGNLIAICIHHNLTVDKSQISDLVSADKRSIVLSTAVDSLFKSLPLTASIRLDTNTKCDTADIL
jgi:hypothetical protein